MRRKSILSSHQALLADILNVILNHHVTSPVCLGSFDTPVPFQAS
jgi:hypothetical protein